MFILLVLSAFFVSTASQAEESASSAIKKKLHTIVLPQVNLQRVSFPEALESIRKLARAHDPEKTGVNFMIKGKVETDQTITLVRSNISLGDALDALVALSGYSMKIDKQSIVFLRAE